MKPDCTNFADETGRVFLRVKADEIRWVKPVKRGLWGYAGLVLVALAALYYSAHVAAWVMR